MALKISRVDIWVGTVSDRPGGLSRILAPLGAAGVNVECAIARRQPDKPGDGIAFIYPVKGPKAEEAARSAGLMKAQNLFTLRVSGPDRPGLGRDITEAVAGSSVNMRGFSAMVIGKECVIFLGFDSSENASKAMQAIQASPAAKVGPKPGPKSGGKKRPAKAPKKAKTKKKR